MGLLVDIEILDLRSQFADITQRMTEAESVVRSVAGVSSSVEKPSSRDFWLEQRGAQGALSEGDWFQYPTADLAPATRRADNIYFLHDGSVRVGGELAEFSLAAGSVPSGWTQESTPQTGFEFNLNSDQILVAARDLFVATSQPVTYYLWLEVFSDVSPNPPTGAVRWKWFINAGFDPPPVRPLVLPLYEIPYDDTATIKAFDLDAIRIRWEGGSPHLAAQGARFMLNILPDTLDKIQVSPGIVNAGNLKFSWTGDHPYHLTGSGFTNVGKGGGTYPVGVTMEVGVVYGMPGFPDSAKPDPVSLPRFNSTEPFVVVWDTNETPPWAGSLGFREYYVPIGRFQTVDDGAGGPLVTDIQQFIFQDITKEARLFPDGDSWLDDEPEFSAWVLGGASAQTLRTLQVRPGADPDDGDIQIFGADSASNNPSIPVIHKASSVDLEWWTADSESPIANNRKSLESVPARDAFQLYDFDAAGGAVQDSDHFIMRSSLPDAVVRYVSWSDMYQRFEDDIESHLSGQGWGPLAPSADGTVTFNDGDSIAHSVTVANGLVTSWIKGGLEQL